MGLPADAANVVRVLLHDGWHDVEPGSFIVGGYWYTMYGEPAANGERVAKSWTQEVQGFGFKDRASGLIISGPTSSLQAVGRSA